MIPPNRQTTAVEMKGTVLHILDHHIWIAEDNREHIVIRRDLRAFADVLLPVGMVQDNLITKVVGCCEFTRRSDAPAGGVEPAVRRWCSECTLQRGDCQGSSRKPRFSQGPALALLRLSAQARWHPHLLSPLSPLLHRPHARSGPHPEARSRYRSPQAWFSQSQANGPDGSPRRYLRQDKRLPP